LWNDKGHGEEEDGQGSVAEGEVGEDVGDGHDGRFSGRRCLLPCRSEDVAQR
jgi:hypothetical protein